MRIALIISSLGLGGAERVLSTMANYWSQKGWEVTLITFSSAESTSYELHPCVARIRLAQAKMSTGFVTGLWNNSRRVLALRREIKGVKPDIIISFIDKTNVLTLLAARGLGRKTIISERVDPSGHPLENPWRFLRRVTYAWSDAVVVQSHGAAEAMRHICEKALVRTIPNPVRLPEADPNDLSNSNLSPEQWKGCLIIAAMGRLTRQKAFDLLLEAFASCSESRPQWKLLILGEGEERVRLEGMVKRLGLSNRVLMPGKTKAPAKILLGADLFVLPSRYEGFPNALLEAMACGLPVISFDCPSGPREIIRDGKDGILVPAEDVTLLAAAMERLMDDEGQRKALGARAREVCTRFSVDKIMEMWEALIGDLLERDG